MKNPNKNVNFAQIANYANTLYDDFDERCYNV